ncbi:MAG: TolC family protein [Lewinellaceae bacterium]|nr:TolC family protein [Lewinellaceae bacterium]
MKYLKFLSCLFIFASTLNAQPILTLEDAVRIALENNYDVRIAANNLSIDRNNVTYGNAGFLPAVGANFSNNNSIESTRQNRSDGTVREGNNVTNSGINYGVGLNWTVFNGFRMFARYDQLKELRNLGEENLRLAMLGKVADVVNLYYDLVQQQQQLAAFDTIISISRVRVNTAQSRLEIGKSSRLEVLNAQVDFNTDTTNLIRQRTLYHNTRIQLNEQLARDVNTEFRVVDTIDIDNTLILSDLSARAAQQNPALQVALINKRVAELELRQVRADRYPVIGLNAGYSFSNSKSALGFATSSRGRGLDYGVTASVNIFNGFNQRRLENNARISIDNAQLVYERTNQNVQSQLATAYQTYVTNLALVQIEKDNQAIAARNLEITLDKFKLGSIATVEFRAAQVNYINATTRYTTAQYEAKLGEVFLRELAGVLGVGR